MRRVGGNIAWTTITRLGKVIKRFVIRIVMTVVTNSSNSSPTIRLIGGALRADRCELVLALTAPELILYASRRQSKADFVG